jgi:hypothetical protein
MEDYLCIPFNKREEIIEKIKQVLLEKKGLVFAFVFGSFLDAPSFRDIDVGIYVNNIKEKEIFDYELELSKKIAAKCGLSFDVFEVKVLNFAPGSFLNNVFKNGRMLFSRNKQMLSDMIEYTSLDAIANEYISLQSLRDLVPV